VPVLNDCPRSKDAAARTECPRSQGAGANTAPVLNDCPRSKDAAARILSLFSRGFLRHEADFCRVPRMLAKGS